MKRMQNESYNDPAPARRRRPRPTGADYFGTAAMLLTLAVSLVFYFRMAATNMLTTKNLVLIMIALLVINGLHVYVQVPLRRNKLGKLICGVLSLLLSAAMIWGMINVRSLEDVLSRITGRMVETDVMVVAVRIDDPAQELEDTRGYLYGYTESVDKTTTDEMLAHLHEKLGDFPTQAADSTVHVVQALYNGDVEAVVINQGFLDLLKEQDTYADFSARARIIYEHTITREIVIPANDASVSEPFIVYCNGIDSRSSDISARSNSDVNILAVVNPASHEILLLNTPRDYYVPLHMNGQRDKLTHAGSYSIEESMNTLADLYGAEIPYYIRLNFYGLVNIVDALGGIDVESPQAFTTIRMEIPKEDWSGLEDRSYSFPEGPVHLTGREALAFSRERYAFSGGDNQRGKNQMAVISSIVDKATSPAVLANFQGLLRAVSEYFVTNIPYDDVLSLVKLQQKSDESWHVTTYAVSGYPDSAICYSYPSYPLYVTRPDYDSVEFAKGLVQQVLRGEVPVLPETEED